MNAEFKEVTPLTNLVDQAVGLVISLSAITLNLKYQLTHTTYKAESTHNLQRPNQKRLAAHPIITLPSVPYKRILN